MSERFPDEVLRESIAAYDEWVPDYEKAHAAMRAVLEGHENAQHSATELSYRRLMWLSHGHSGLYGDDGEMQCGMCRVGDYKRQPLADVERAFEDACLERLARDIKASDGSQK